jgi:hypothetical protein
MTTSYVSFDEVSEGSGILFFIILKMVSTAGKYSRLD